MNTECPKCKSAHIYQDMSLWICPECAHEWTETESLSSNEESNTASDNVITDANNNVLASGDTVVVIKDLKIKGAGGVVKGGTKVKNIRLDDAGDGHDISCKIPGLGNINLKSEYVRKV